ncbi:DUF6207 family protein [Streptomyces sp. NPDC014734]|uniref:DUF6207 family protein n=1 Tax=Streptomyces sp. NPDC014734 TaxID=3364886 RepID=UPI0036F61CD6
MVPGPPTNRPGPTRRRSGHGTNRRAAHRGARPGGNGYHRRGRGDRPRAALEERWATSGTSPVRRDPGEPGVRARLLADVLRPGRQ